VDALHLLNKSDEVPRRPIKKVFIGRRGHRLGGEKLGRELPLAIQGKLRQRILVDCAKL
jgi:hypothetical protein